MAIVLMVEDEEQIRVPAESVLEEAGHKGITATGIEGAKALLDIDQRIDVLFLDLNLGGDPEAGLLVAQQAQAKRPTLSYLHDGRARQRRYEGHVRRAVPVSS
jgi:DNA-binding NtrC family response regulator